MSENGLMVTFLGNMNFLNGKLSYKYKVIKRCVQYLFRLGIGLVVLVIRWGNDDSDAQSLLLLACSKNNGER
jgi:hypothetical protein